jgi:hypothetical protein
MKLNECFIVPKSIIVSIQAIAVETQNKELMVLTEMCRVAYNLPEEVVNNAFEAGKESVTTRDGEGFPYWEGTNIEAEEYIKNLEL